jgi:raffinose/stachyose/melibiose transport system permease protein
MSINRRILTGFIITVVAVLQFFPILWLFNFSLLPNSDFFGSALLKWPNPAKWKNYADAFTYGHVLRFFLNSVLVTAATIAGTAIASIFMAYAFTRMVWKWKTVVLAAVLVGIIIPVQTTMLANFSIFRDIGLLDTYWALILPGIAFNIPIGTLILTGFMTSLPRELEEVGVMDGLSIMRLITQIVIPLCKPAIAAVGVIIFMSSWSDYITPLTFINSEHLKTLPFSIIQFQGQYSSNYGAQFAVLVLTSLPAIVTYLLFSEHITKGIFAGAVKG